jgi:hypothetical protein
MEGEGGWKREVGGERRVEEQVEERGPGEGSISSAFIPCRCR